MPCRAATHAVCDIAEYCDGVSAQCPPDVGALPETECSQPELISGVCVPRPGAELACAITGVSTSVNRNWQCNTSKQCVSVDVPAEASGASCSLDQTNPLYTGFVPNFNCAPLVPEASAWKWQLDAGCTLSSCGVFDQNAAVGSDPYYETVVDDDVDGLPGPGFSSDVQLPTITPGENLSLDEYQTYWLDHSARLTIALSSGGLESWAHAQDATPDPMDGAVAEGIPSTRWWETGCGSDTVMTRTVSAARCSSTTETCETTYFTETVTLRRIPFGLPCQVAPGVEGVCIPLDDGPDVNGDGMPDGDRKADRLTNGAYDSVCCDPMNSHNNIYDCDGGGTPNSRPGDFVPSWWFQQWNANRNVILDRDWTTWSSWEPLNDGSTDQVCDPTDSSCSQP
jgi:hypothetical protein